jgi:Flp pilus assembly secretin CpaC
MWQQARPRQRETPLPKETENGLAQPRESLSMKALPLCVLLALSVTAYAQEPAPGQQPPAPAQVQPDVTGQRLQQLRQQADELQKAGQQTQAALVRQQAEWERQALLQHLDALQAETNRIRKIVGGVPQVLVHLKVFEVSLTKLRQLGYDVSKLSGAPTTTADGKDVKNATTPTGLPVISDGNETLKLIEALQKDHLLRMISEPTLVTTSGSPATFRSGGELPIPSPTKDNQARVEYEHYGTEIQLLPTMLGDRALRIEVHGRIGELDEAHSIQVEKQTIPGLRVREFTTNAEFHLGQTLVISGSIENHVEAENSGLPYVSEIPYAGAVFRKVKETHNEIALFVVLTPEIIESDVAPATPINVPSEPATPRR